MNKFQMLFPLIGGTKEKVQGLAGITGNNGNNLLSV